MNKNLFEDNDKEALSTEKLITTFVECINNPKNILFINYNTVKTQRGTHIEMIELVVSNYSYSIVASITMFFDKNDEFYHYEMACNGKSVDYDKQMETFLANNKSKFENIYNSMAWNKRSNKKNILSNIVQILIAVLLFLIAIMYINT